MDIEVMKNQKEEYGFTCDDIAKKTGVPVSTVRKVFSGETKHPRRKTLEAMERFFNRSVTYDYLSRPQPLSVSEPGSSYGAMHKNRLFTLDDYYRMPDQPRAELIDGRFYLMAAPNLIHQRLGGYVFAQLFNYISSHGKPCECFQAPTDVQLDPEDDSTIVQPDVFVVCDKNKSENERRVIGAPELVVEILSPANRKHDMVIKKKKYEQVGVREYWIVDPDSFTVTTICFEENSLIHLYSFRDPIPVDLTEGELVMDLSSFYHD